MRVLKGVAIIAVSAVLVFGVIRLGRAIAAPVQHESPQVEVEITCVNGVPVGVSIGTTGAGFWVGTLACPQEPERERARAET